MLYLEMAGKNGKIHNSVENISDALIVNTSESRINEEKGWTKVQDNGRP
jgi:hypothetical protein